MATEAEHQINSQGLPRIHPTALVDPKAELAEGVEIGAYSIVGPGVRIGRATQIGPHVVLDGLTTIGADNRIAPFCSIGGPPQDKKYAGEPTRLEIGDRNVIRESCTFNTGTVQDGGVTRVGNDNWIMAYVHVAHDCWLGDNIILANSTQLAGHVHIGDWVILGGMTGVHQFVRIGAHAMTSANTYLSQDLPTYVLAAGTPGQPHGVNSEGLRRRGFTTASISAIRTAYKTLYRNGLGLEEARTKITEQIAADHESAPQVQPLLDFISAAGRGIVR